MEKLKVYEKDGEIVFKDKQGNLITTKDQINNAENTKSIGFMLFLALSSFTIVFTAMVFIQMYNRPGDPSVKVKNIFFNKKYF